MEEKTISSYKNLIMAGLRWLRVAQNADGGWGYMIDEPTDLKASSFIEWSYFAKYCSIKCPGVVRKQARLFQRVQNLDGGWSKGILDPSCVNVTCSVVSILVNLDVDRKAGVIQRASSWLKERQLSDGGWGEAEDCENRKQSKVYTTPGLSTPWITALAISALINAGENRFSDTITKAIDYLLKRQNKDGGWSIISGERSESDGTAFSISSLRAAGFSGESTMIQKAVKFLVELQNKDGGWGWFGIESREPSDVKSTERKIHALLDAGVDKGSRVVMKGVEFLLSQRNMDGGWGIRWNQPTCTYITAGVVSLLSRLA